MKLRIDPKYVAAGLLSAMIAAPALSFAQSIHHRRQTENQWRSLTYGSAALGILGLASHNGTMTTLGTAGTLYSGHRWQEDMKSRHRSERERAELFSHRHIYVHGHHYVRHTTMKHGHKYYYFSRQG